MTAFLVNVALISFALGFACAACLFLRSKRTRNTSASYFHFQGDPQPGHWKAEHADLLRRKGAV